MSFHDWRTAAPSNHRLQADAGRRTQQRSIPDRALRPDASCSAPYRARRWCPVSSPRPAHGRNDWSQIHDQRHKLFDLLASMVDWHRYDELSGKGLKPPGEPSCCSVCRWDKDAQCVRRLGPKHEGYRLTHWTEASRGAQKGSEPSGCHSTGRTIPCLGSGPRDDHRQESNTTESVAEADRSLEPREQNNWKCGSLTACSAQKGGPSRRGTVFRRGLC